MSPTGQTQETEALSYLCNARGHVLAVDTETNGKDIRDGRGYAIGVSTSYLDTFGYHNHYFPFRHTLGDNYDPSILARLKEVVEAAPKVVFHNAKFDLVSLRTLGIDYFGRDWYCTMVMAHLINENWPRSKSLDSCAAAYLGEGFRKLKTDELDTIAKSFGWDMIPVSVMRPYAEMDTELTYRLAGVLFEKFIAENLMDYWTYKRKLIETVILMESRGVGIDTELCEKMIEEAEYRMGDYSDMIGGLNPRSPVDMKSLFIDRLGLPPQYNLKTGKLTFDKTAMSVYDQILERRNDPLAQYVQAYRGWGHTSSLFYKPYLAYLSPDGRLRPSYMHHKDEAEGGTVTGRLSCRNPNLQQIPRVSDKPWNGTLKKAFLPSPGYTLYEADYSQLELRLATAYADETSLKVVFNEGRDIFSEMAEAIHLTRQDTKTFVYSTQYGAGVNRIMNVFGITETEARNIRERYFEAYPGFRALSEKASAKARNNGKAQLWSGRYRHFRDPRNEAHKALNSVIQGGAADIVERQMIRLREEVDGPDARMLLQVHDSVIFEIRNGVEAGALPEIKRIMEDVRPDFDVRFAVDVHKFGD